MSMPPLPWPQIRHAATGRYGQEVFRHLDKVMLHAVGVADSKADKPRPKGGSDLVILPRWREGQELGGQEASWGLRMCRFHVHGRQV